MLRPDLLRSRLFSISLPKAALIPIYGSVDLSIRMENGSGRTEQNSVTLIGMISSLIIMKAARPAFVLQIKKSSTLNGLRIKENGMIQLTRETKKRS